MSAWIEFWKESPLWAEKLFVAIVQSVMVILFAMAIARLLRSRGAVVRSAVWRAALLIMLLCPAVSAIAQSAGLPLLALPLPTVPSGGAKVVVEKSDALAPTTPSHSRSAEFEVVSRSSERRNELEHETAVLPIKNDIGEAEQSAAAFVPSRTIWRVLAGIWLVGVLLLLARLATAYAFVRSAIRRGVVADAKVLSACEQCARQLQVSPPKVLLVESISSPCLVGWLHPAILLPAAMKTVGKDVLIHELAHLKRGDCFWSLLARICRSVLWIQPLTWLLVRRLEQTADEVCDDYVVAHGEDRRAYARRLLEIAEHWQLSGSVAEAAVGVVTFKSTLGRRVARILDSSRVLSLRLNGWGVLGVLAFGLIFGATGTLLGGLLGGSAAPTTPAVTTGPEQEKKKSSNPTRAEPTDDLSRIGGQVLNMLGRPVSGARIVWQWKEKNGQAKQREAVADKVGRFTITANSAAARSGVIFALHDDYGLDWIRPGSLQANKRSPAKVAFRLPNAKPVIRGQLVDLQGKPAPGVTIMIRRVGKKPDAEKLTKWIEKNVALRKRGRYLNEEQLDVVSLDSAVPLQTKTTTDEQGRFQLAGVGADRVVRLHVQGPAVEWLRLWSITREGPQEGLITGMFGLYYAEFQLIVGPTKPFVGVVRDRRTRKPIPGVTVADAGRSRARTVTDKNGRYRLAGAAKREFYYLTAGGGKGRPYFDLTKNRIGDTPGFDPITVDFELERGLEVSGRLYNKDSGKGVAGWVMYFPFPDNPHLKEYETFGKATISISRWGRPGADGQFTELAIPGPGVLVAGSHQEDAYAILDPAERLRKWKIRSFPVRTTHAVIRIDPREGDPKSLRYDIALEPAGQVAGQLVDPEGKPVSGVHASGLDAPRITFASFGANRPPHQPLPDAKFIVKGVGNSQSRPVVFFQPQRKLGKVVQVLGEKPQLGEVALEPLGSARGKLVDASGKPFAGAGILVTISRRGADDVRLPWTDLFQSGFAVLLSRTARTGDDGEFRVDSLLPGVPYNVTAFYGKKLQRTNRLAHRTAVFVKAGKTTRMETLQSSLPQPAKKPASK